MQWMSIDWNDTTFTTDRWILEMCDSLEQFDAVRK